MGPKRFNRVTIFFVPHVPNFLQTPSSVLPLFSDLQQPPTCSSHAQDASPEFRLHSNLSTSNQHCVDLSRIENYNFLMGPNKYSRITMFFGPPVANFLDAPSSLVLLFSDLQRPPICCSHAHDASPDFRLHNVISTSGSTLSRFEPHGKL